MSNLIEDLRTCVKLLDWWWMETSNDGRDAIQGVYTLLESYDALAPDWATAPKGATHYAVDANGLRAWYRGRPMQKSDAWATHLMVSLASRIVEPLPIGIDWRLCIWQRPPAQEQP